MKELFALSKKEPTTVSKSLQHIGMNKIFHKTLILCGHPLKRMVGIMMRPQRAERATIICSVGSWDPTIVPTPDSTEGNYFRITTRSAAAAAARSSSSSSKQQHFAAAAAAVSAAVEAADSVVATVSSHRPQLKLLRCMEQSGKQLSTEQQRTSENSGGKQPVEIWREQES